MGKLAGWQYAMLGWNYGSQECRGTWYLTVLVCSTICAPCHYSVLLQLTRVWINLRFGLSGLEGSRTEGIPPFLCFRKAFGNRSSQCVCRTASRMVTCWHSPVVPCVGPSQKGRKDLRPWEPQRAVLDSSVMPGTCPCGSRDAEVFTVHIRFWFLSSITLFDQ